MTNERGEKTVEREEVNVETALLEREEKREREDFDFVSLSLSIFFSSTLSLFNLLL